MDNKKQRKTDRRTTYTINTVKDAMLELLEKEPFDKITVASLCRQAEITRTTFYLHFSDITAVLDELLKDALQVAENSSIQDKDNILPIYAKEKNIEKIKENDILPSVRTMAKELKISALTVKKAYDNLETEGMTVTVHGKGTYVAASNTQLMEEERRKEVEADLEAAIQKGRRCGMKEEEIRSLFELIMEDEYLC